MLIQTKLTLLAVLIVFSAFFSGVETAFFSLSRLRVKHLKRKQVKGAAVLDALKENPQRLLTTILIGNNIVNIGASALATSIAYDFSLGYAVSIATGIMTLIILLFGEITPKSIATKHNEKISLSVAAAIRALEIILLPVSFIFEFWAGLITGSQKKEPLVTEEEIKTYVALSRKAGQIKESEKELIHKIFVFNDIEAKEVMTPRNRIVGVNAHKRIKDAIKLFQKKGHTRLLVYKDNLDKIIGFLHFKDVHKALLKRKNPKVEGIMRKIVFVPSTKKLDILLKFFQRKKQHIAVVVNEFGTNIGIVTIEDILEEIVGEIIDETEKIEPLIRKISRKSFIVSGKADIDEINEKCGTSIPETKAPYTFSSYILKSIDRIPFEGEVINLPECKIKIKQIENNNINLVTITKKQESKKLKNRKNFKKIKEKKRHGCKKRGFQG